MTGSRWLQAQALEAAVESAEDVKEWLDVRRDTWCRLLRVLSSQGLVNEARRVLDVGGKATTIFLAWGSGERFAVDPIYSSLFRQHPFLENLEEYKGVNFVPIPVEVFEAEPFDLVFCINALDHMADLEAVARKLESLLAPRGRLILLVDCYADEQVRRIVRWFDVDLPHPHHLVTKDVVGLFRRLSLRLYDPLVFRIFHTGRVFSRKGVEIPVHRLDRLYQRFTDLLNQYGKRRDLLFAARFAVCYGLALVIAVVERREVPIHPLKKVRLFVFEKP